MKYFIDTEFIEHFHKPLFGKARHVIDLVSIGIYCEDGREYYAVSNEFNPKYADKWVKENVIDKIELELYRKESVYAKTYHAESLKLKNLLRWHGKSNKQIANEILRFICPYEKESEYVEMESEYVEMESIDKGTRYFLEANPPEFYGYYSDYDWVVFCSLFGRMIDLPKGFPMYCKDLKQDFDDVFMPSMRKEVKKSERYPKQENEHNALADAKWNYQLYKFIYGD